jgi:hypothetical protein
MQNIKRFNNQTFATLLVSDLTEPNNNKRQLKSIDL